MEYTLKKITLMQRAEINDRLFKQDIVTACVLACKYGLETLNGESITNRNADEKINELDIDEISKIGNETIEASNFPKKK